jgi:hypothetical protein
MNIMAELEFTVVWGDGGAAETAMVRIDGERVSIGFKGDILDKFCLVIEAKDIEKLAGLCKVAKDQT